MPKTLRHSKWECGTRQGKEVSRGSLNSSWNQNCCPPCFYIPFVNFYSFLYCSSSLSASLSSPCFLPFGIWLCGESVEGLRCHWQQTGYALPLPRSLSLCPSLGIFLEFHNNYNFVCVFACLGGGGEGVPASAAGRKLCQPTKSWTRFTEYLWQHAWQVPFTVNSLPLPDHFHSFSDRWRGWGEAA